MIAAQAANAWGRAVFDLINVTTELKFRENMNAASTQRRCKQVVLPQFRRPVRRKSFDTYRCADDKDVVIDLLLRVTTVSVAPAPSTVTPQWRKSTRWYTSM